MRRVFSVVVACVLVVSAVAEPEPEPEPRLRGGGRYGDRYGPHRRPTQAILSGDAEFERANKMPGLPLDVAQTLNDAKDLKDLERLVDRPWRMKDDVMVMARNAGGDLLGNRFGSRDDSGNKNGEMAKAAVCKPELTTVPVKEDKGPNTIYWPSCTRVERCGGCCSHELLSCKPVSSRTIHVQVVRAEYQGGSSQFRYTGTEMVPLEIHTECECGCKLSAQDCNDFQEYVPNECRCKCVNKEDFNKCSRNSEKLWEPSTCRCKCKTEKECSTGHFFDLNTCSCRVLPPREARPFDPSANRFFQSFSNFYSSDNRPVSDDNSQQARHAEPADSGRTDAPSSRRVRVRGPQRSSRYDERTRRY